MPLELDCLSGIFCSSGETYLSFVPEVVKAFVNLSTTLAAPDHLAEAIARRCLR